MNPHKYLDLKQAVIDHGYEHEIEWAENVKKCEDSAFFCQQYIWVICNSGMKNQIAEIIYKRILKAIVDHVDISKVFGHKGKVDAIKSMIKWHRTRFELYLKAEDKLEFCEGLPWIGKITKYHLCKNLGENVIKPDRHLVRIAKLYDTDPFSLCQKLSERLGDNLHTVDVVIWRAANLGLI
ncbi:hypothetical protein KAR91_43570 [Candidatus Pacearchaeota archaeon]|nr:hypothetical protein [Candidatus Pacearchaeota archaeon]